MKSFLKKYWYFVILAFLVTVLAALKIAVRNSPSSETLPTITPSPTPTKVPPAAPTWIIYPPITPISSYSPWEKVWPTQAIVPNNDPQLTMTKEFYSSKTKNYHDYLDQYGYPDKELFGPDAAAGFSVFTFLKSGLAIVANPSNGLVIEVWHFPPTTLENFLNYYGPDLSTEPIIQF